MPKENIHCLTDTQRRVELAWMKGCWVQLGTVVRPDPDPTTDSTKDSTTDGGEDPVAEETGAGETDTETLTEEMAGGVQGIFIDLDRPGINRLITCLRRARDSAFGRDA